MAVCDSGLVRINTFWRNNDRFSFLEAFCGYSWRAKKPRSADLFVLEFCTGPVFQYRSRPVPANICPGPVPLPLS